MMCEWMTRPVLPRLMTVLQAVAFLFRHGSMLAASCRFEPLISRIRIERALLAELRGSGEQGAYAPLSL